MIIREEEAKKSKQNEKTLDFQRRRIPEIRLEGGRIGFSFHGFKCTFFQREISTHLEEGLKIKTRGHKTEGIGIIHQHTQEPKQPGRPETKR